MSNFLLNSGCTNATFWFVIVASLAIALRRKPTEHRLIFTMVFSCLLVGTIGNIFLAMYRAYAVPRDILQDVVSAQEYLEGRPLYPADMTERINQAMAREGPRPSLLERWPNLRQREREQLQEALSSHWVQAHPPFMTLFTAPFVKYLGILGTQIAFVLIAVASLASILLMIRVELFPQVAGGWFILAGVALLGWDPVLTTLRSEQASLLLSALLTSSWLMLRRGHSGWAGFVAGMAVSLKLIPAVILLVFVIRHRRAFVTAMATFASIALLTLLATSQQDYVDFFQTSRGVVEEYAAYSGNISLLGALARGIRDLRLPFDQARGLWLASGVVAAIGFAWTMRHPPCPDRHGETLDLEFALAMTLMVILSPVAWDHYLTFLILPLAVLLRRTGGKLGPLFVLFAIPDTTFSWLLSLGTAGGWHAFAIWVIMPLRAAGLVFLAGRFASEMTKEPYRCAAARD